MTATTREAFFALFDEEKALATQIAGMVDVVQHYERVIADAVLADQQPNPDDVAHLRRHRSDVIVSALAMPTCRRRARHPRGCWGDEQVADEA